MKFLNGHLAYCTNIHPAETWQETFHNLKTHTLRVRELLVNDSEPFALGLRLSAKAAGTLLEGESLEEFKKWMEHTNTYLLTINGFPHDDFHNTRVKERVFKPDWSSNDRLDYTKNLFRILAKLLSPGSEGSVSSLPGSHKFFHANRNVIYKNLRQLANWLDDLCAEYSLDLHLGLEPEPFGLFEDTEESLKFFDALGDSSKLRRRIGLNYDTCHFACQFEEPSLAAFVDSGIRISKIQLSNAIQINPQNKDAINAVKSFADDTYFHQTIAQQSDGSLTRFPDLPEFLMAEESHAKFDRARIHYHIPLDSKPASPLESTRDHLLGILQYCKKHPQLCNHYEIETYTWGVLPKQLQLPIENQIVNEYKWVLQNS